MPARIGSCWRRKDGRPCACSPLCAPHGPLRVPAAFDFWRYLSESMEDDFSHLVGVNLEMVHWMGE